MFSFTFGHFGVGEWSFEYSGSRKFFVKFHGSCSLVFSGYVCRAVWIFVRSSLGVSVFCKADNGLEDPIRSFVFINEVFSMFSSLEKKF